VTEVVPGIEGFFLSNFSRAACSTLSCRVLRPSSETQFEDAHEVGIGSALKNHKEGMTNG
jgi:hypothetical protein